MYLKMVTKDIPLYEKGYYVMVRSTLFIVLNSQLTKKERSKVRQKLINDFLRQNKKARNH